MRMKFLLCAALLLGPTVARAQPAGPRETLILLTVRPAAAPRPALRYQLLPEVRELHTGNPVQGYLKCFMEQQHFFFDPQSLQEREQLLSGPLSDLKGRLHYGGAALLRADEAARLDPADWQVYREARRDGYRLLMPEVQQLRHLAAALRVRFRAEVAAERYDDAVVTAKTMFALARHLGEHPTVIADLVGAAVAFQALGTLEEMVQQPTGPNLFWALTALPGHLIDFRKGLEGERFFLQAEFADVDLERPQDDAAVQKVVDRLEKWQPSTRTWLEEHARDKDHVAAARKRLAEAGTDEKALQKFSALQVLLLDEKRDYQARLDEGLKWMTLPYWQAEPGFRGGIASADAKGTLLGEFLPVPLKIRQAQARLEQRLALLRHVEAVRLYAADHDGRPPARLLDLTVPLPPDPVTGEPFGYSADGPTFHLRGAAPHGQHANPSYNVHYQVTIKK